MTQVQLLVLVISGTEICCQSSVFAQITGPVNCSKIEN